MLLSFDKAKLCFCCFILINQYVMGIEIKPFPIAKLKERPKNIFELERNLSLIKRKDLFQLLRDFIATTSEGRMVGTRGQKTAREVLKKLIDGLTHGKGTLKVDAFLPKVSKAIDKIENDFKLNIANHLKPKEPEYQRSKRFKESFISYLKENKATEGRNLIWEKRGNEFPEEILIILAHYDTLGVNKQDQVDASIASPGADDNGTGVVLALKLIQLFSRMDIPRTLRVVFLDWEELGSLGSLAFVKRYQAEFKNKKVLGYINLEMLGHDSRGLDQTKKFFNMRSYYRRPGSPLFEKEKAFLEDFLKKGRGIEKGIKFTPVGNSHPHSGSLGQWDSSLIGATFSQNWEEDFNLKGNHNSNDFIETLNLKTYYRAFRFIAAATGRLIFSF